MNTSKCAPTKHQNEELKNLSDDKKLFVENFNGFPTATARKLFSGNYLKVRQIGMDFMKDQSVWSTSCGPDVVECLWWY
jgi:hypothetical protein